MENERVVLVDESGNPIGTEEKIAAHLSGKLHLALSIYVFNSTGSLMVQRRAFGKYHSGGLLTNTCCSHPLPGEDVPAAAHRRLKEEMGFDCPLRSLFTMRYKVDVGGRMVEHEFGHVFVGTYDEPANPNPEEAATWFWATPEYLRWDIQDHPDRYTEWFKIALAMVLAHPNFAAN